MVRKSWIWRDFSITVKIFFDIFLIKTFPDWCDKSHIFCLVKHLANIRKWLTLSSFQSYFRYTTYITSCSIIPFMIIFITVIQQNSWFSTKRFCFQEERCNVENDGPRSLSKNICYCHFLLEIFMPCMYLWFF